MRLIDAEELKHILNNSKYYGTKAGNAFADMIAECESIKERKKGKWMRNSNGTYSCCLFQSWIPNEQRYYANYCLFCDADMREGKADDTK